MENHQINENYDEKILLFALLSCFCVLTGTEWKAPGAEPVPESVVYPSPLSAARWLWFQADEVKPGEAFFRYTVDLSETPVAAYAFVLMDDDGEMRVNDESPVWGYPDQPRHFQVKIPRYELGKLLKKGKNVLSFHVRNQLLTGGLFLCGGITLPGGKEIPLLSTSAIKAASNASGKWRSAGYDDSGWKSAWEFGDALTPPWNNASDIFTFGLSAEEKAFKQRCFEKAVAMSEKIAEERPKKVRLKLDRAVPSIEVDGELIPPVLDMCNNPWFSGKADMSVKLARTGVRWHEVMLIDYDCIRENGYDFSGLDASIRRILTLHPEAFVGFSIRFTHRMYRWMEEHPEELVGYSTGKADQNNDTLRRRAPSIASEAYRREIGTLTAELMKYVKRQPWFKRLISVRISYGCYSEWHYYGMRRDMPDTGKAMTVAFRKFLRKRYGSDDALEKAWKTPGVSIDSAAVPGVVEREGRGHFLRDPGSSERKVIDYYECHQSVVADGLLALARMIKQAAPDLLVGAYYGYAIQMNFPSEGQTILLDRVLSSPDIDFLSAPICYDSARAAGGDGLKRSIPSVFRRYGKLHIVEQDTRTHITYPHDLTPVLSAGMFAHDTANALLDGCGTQLLSLNGVGGMNWMNSPEILSSIRDGIKLWKKLHKEPKRENSNSVAVVFHSREMIWHGFPTVEKQRHAITALTTDTLHALRKSGHAFDLLDVNGFLAAPEKYKAVIFLNLFSPDSATGKKVARAVRRAGMTAFWLYAPGLVTENGWSESAASELTGITLKMQEGSVMTLKTREGGTIATRPEIELSPRLAAIDPEAEQLAFYTDFPQAAGLVRKQLATGAVSVFSGVPVTDPDWWSRVLSQAGVEAFARPGVVVKGFGNRILIPTAKAAEIEFRPPAGVREIRDLRRGDRIPVSGGRVILKSSGPATWLLEF